VTGQDSVDALIAATLTQWGRVDVVVCNAGIVTLKGLEEMPLEEFERIMKVNVSGVFLTAQAGARQMIRQGGGGSIIVTASMSARVINTPPIALAQARAETARMIRITGEVVEETVALLNDQDTRRMTVLQSKEDHVDQLQREITDFLVILSQQAITEVTSREVSA
jgi:NAD(P)-dependent dehydrogenase (short-subunit alcohol dehydrogenase family)